MKSSPHSLYIQKSQENGSWENSGERDQKATDRLDLNAVAPEESHIPQSQYRGKYDTHSLYIFYFYE